MSSGASRIVVVRRAPCRSATVPTPSSPAAAAATNSSEVTSRRASHHSASSASFLNSGVSSRSLSVDSNLHSPRVVCSNNPDLVASFGRDHRQEASIICNPYLHSPIFPVPQHAPEVQRIVHHHFFYFVWKHSMPGNMPNVAFVPVEFHCFLSIIPAANS